MTIDDKRDADRERVPLAGQVTGEVMVYQPVTILDISHGGAQIETPYPLQLDSLHDFRLALGPRSIVVKGRIAHCHVEELTESSALFRTGVEFIEPSEHVREAIAGFVAALKAANSAAAIIDAEYADEAGK
jgi:PilZ domain-containing protein